MKITVLFLLVMVRLSVLDASDDTNLLPAGAGCASAHASVVRAYKIDVTKYNPISQFILLYDATLQHLGYKPLSPTAVVDIEVDITEKQTYPSKFQSFRRSINLQELGRVGLDTTHYRASLFESELNNLTTGHTYEYENVFGVTRDERYRGVVEEFNYAARATNIYGVPRISASKLNQTYYDHSLLSDVDKVLINVDITERQPVESLVAYMAASRTIKLKLDLDDIRKVSSARADYKLSSVLSAHETTSIPNSALPKQERELNKLFKHAYLRADGSRVISFEQKSKLSKSKKTALCFGICKEVLD